MIYSPNAKASSFDLGLPSSLKRIFPSQVFGRRGGVRADCNWLWRKNLEGWISRLGSLEPRLIVVAVAGLEMALQGSMDLGEEEYWVSVDRVVGKKSAMVIYRVTLGRSAAQQWKY